MSSSSEKMFTLNFLNEKKLSIDIIVVLEEALSKSIGPFKNDLSEVIEALKSADFWLTNHEINYLKNNPSNTAEYMVFRYKFRTHPSSKRLCDFPLHILVEPASVCNLRCVMCFQADSSFRKAPFAGYMTPEVFKSVVDECHDCGLQAFTISGRGEPLLNKKIGRMLRYAGGKFFDFKLNTNATVLNEKLCHDILEAGVTEMVFSIDSADPVQYANIRVGGDLREVISNIETFNEIRAKYYNESQIQTRISAVQVSVEQDMERFAEFWRKLADDVSYTKEIDRRDTYHNAPSMPSQFCQRLWHRLYIWFDGISSPCDYDYKSQLGVGNVKEEGISGVWTGGRFRQLREIHSTGGRSTLVPCDRCSL